MPTIHDISKRRRINWWEPTLSLQACCAYYDTSYIQANSPAKQVSHVFK